MGSILAACKDSQHTFILHCKSSVLMWAALKKVHIKNQMKVNIHYYFEELFTRKYVESALMPDHIAAMLNIKRRITQAGEDLKDIIVAWAIIISLPKTQTWEFIKISLFEVESLTSEIVCTWLMQEANRWAHKKGLDESALIMMDTKAKRSTTRVKNHTDTTIEKTTVVMVAVVAKMATVTGAIVIATVVAVVPSQTTDAVTANGRVTGQISASNK
jgi:gag-polypeptide of LTR copia-type